jgi:hypothetical protein
VSQCFLELVPAAFRALAEYCEADLPPLSPLSTVLLVSTSVFLLRLSVLPCMVNLLCDRSQK